MIRLHRLNGSEIVINPELIEWIEANPDTTISLATGSKIITADSLDSVIQKVMAYRRALGNSDPLTTKNMLAAYKRG